MAAAGVGPALDADAEPLSLSRDNSREGKLSSVRRNPGVPSTMSALGHTQTLPFHHQSDYGTHDLHR